MGRYSTQREVEIKVDYEKATRLAKTLVSMYHDKKPPFQIPNLFPDAIVPEGTKVGSKRHALFLFYACSMDSMVQANEHYSNMRDLFSKLDFQYFHKIRDKALEELLVEHKINLKMGDAINTVKENSRRLSRDYDGDPRKIFSGFGKKEIANDDDMDKTFRHLQIFNQYRVTYLNDFGFVTGIGKSALLAKNYVRFGIWSFKETDIPIKIDRHAMRICIPNVIEFYIGGTRNGAKIPDSEIINVRSDKLIELLTSSFMHVTRENNISAVELNDSFWAVGSSLCLYNTFSSCKSFCPIDCTYRPKSDPTTTMFYPGTEKRVHINRKSIISPSQLKLF